MSRICLVLLLFLALGRTVSAQIVDSIFYGDSRTVLKNPYGWGYIAGTNEYGDRGKYQRIETFEQPYLVAARLYFGVARIVGTPDPIHVVVRDVNTDGSPAGIITEVSTTLDQFDTTGVGTMVFFQNPARFAGEWFTTDSLFVGIEWSEAGDDTFALSCDPGGFGEAADRVWELIHNPNNADTLVMWSWVNTSDWTWALDSDLWIKAYLSPNATSVGNGSPDVPLTLTLSQNYPNPFNPSTTLEFTVPRSGPAVIRAFNILGVEVARIFDGNAEAGSIHRATFDAHGLPSGMYFARLESGGTRLTRSMVLTR